MAETAAEPIELQTAVQQISHLDVELATASLSKRSDVDPFLVTFNESFDEDNPKCWSSGKKWTVTDVLSASSFNRILLSTIMAPALPTIAAELNMSATESIMALSSYILTTTFGPLVLGPLSEVHGHAPIMHVSNVWFLIFNLICGFARTKEELIACRFLAGFGASAIYALAGGVLGDVRRPEQRGKTLGVYLLIPVMGAAVGPIGGGFMAGRANWRWMFWSTSAFQAAMMIASYFAYHETYAPTILHRRAKKLRKATGNTQYYTVQERTLQGRSLPQIIYTSLLRPLRLLAFNHIIQIMACFSGIGYGLLYILLTTFSSLYVTAYHESVEISGLHYLAPALGEIAGP